MESDLYRWRTLTITVNPNQEKAVRGSCRIEQISSVEELIDRALAFVQENILTSSHSSKPAEHGLGLSSSPENAALLDEIVSLTYTERRQDRRCCVQ